MTHDNWIQATSKKMEVSTFIIASDIVCMAYVKALQEMNDTEHATFVLLCLQAMTYVLACILVIEST